MVVKIPSSLAVAGSSLALLISVLNGTATAQGPTTSVDTTHSLPSVTVERPSEAIRHKPRHQTAARGTMSRLAPETTQTSSAASMSITAKLAKLASNTGSCAGG